MTHFYFISTFLLLLCQPFIVEGQKASTKPFDVLIKGGLVYDGTGKAPLRADVGIRGDRIVAVCDLSSESAKTDIDARGLVVSPGFINMLSGSVESFIIDGRSQGEIRQGVTTQIFGESTMGPLSEKMKQQWLADQGNFKYDIPWTTLFEYLTYLEKRGISQNVASFVGSGTVRECIMGQENKPPTPDQLKQMCDLVRCEMEGGALGISSALIYPPDVYASTEELIALCKVAAHYKGMYISHIRSEGDRLIEGAEELIRISREAKLPAEIYHLKAAGMENWHKMDQVIAMILKARRDGLSITADMYVYTAGASLLTASIPPWAQDGGFQVLVKRLRDPATRQHIIEEMRKPSPDWENIYLLAGSPDRVMLFWFQSDVLQAFTGKTLAEVAKIRGRDPIETMIDLVVEDGTQVGAIYFMMSEENLIKQIRQIWVSLCSDAPSMAPEGEFIRTSTHPRAYGNFARLLGKYVRDEHVLTLQEAIRRLSGLPATNLGLDHRGFIKKGMFADVAVFDPSTIADRATFERPHQYAVGMKHVFVNGVQVLKDGEHTGAKPGIALWGPGKINK